MRRRKNASAAAEPLVLGISVSSRTLHGVLIERTPEGPRLLRRLTRTRGEAMLPTSVTSSTYAHADHDTPDELNSLQIGDVPGGGDIFLSSEFSSLLSQPGGAPGVPGRKNSAAVSDHDLFTNELLDMVAEVRDALGQEPAIAFVASADDVTYAQVHVADVARENADKRRTRLMAALAEQVHDVDAERTVFLPVAPTSDEQVHALALVPRLPDPVTQTLSAAIGHRRTIRPCLLDAELSLLIGLARLAPLAPPAYDAFYGAGSTEGDGAGRDHSLPVLAVEEEAAPEGVVPDGTTLVLRAGIEDTLALFLKDGQLQYFERMRSVTAFDAPETLCSRILLIQDEHGVGELARVLLLGEQGEGDLTDAFGLFFPEANVGSIRSALPGTLAEEALAVREAGPVLALAAALRLSESAAMPGVFPDVNFLPLTLTRRRFVVPYTWHVYLLLGLLFMTVLFFVARFYTYQVDITEQRQAVLLVDPASAEANVQQLQGRLDSLQSAQQQYAQALGVLDSLLLGSDRWSRALDLVSREASGVRGVWIENWEQDGDQITLNGNATQREAVVTFAERTGGNLQAITFEEIRDFPTYAFTLTIPLATDLPEAVRYLREVAAQQAGLSAPTPDAPAPADSAAAPAPTN